MQRIIPRFPPSFFEAGAWIVGLAALCISNPRAESVIELCVFKWMGFSGCPGCGLGHAIGFLARGEWALAVESHWMSPVVVVVLLGRIGTLLLSKK